MAENVTFIHNRMVQQLNSMLPIRLFEILFVVFACYLPATVYSGLIIYIIIADFVVLVVLIKYALWVRKASKFEKDSIQSRFMRYLPYWLAYYCLLGILIYSWISILLHLSHHVVYNDYKSYMNIVAFATLQIILQAVLIWAYFMHHIFFLNEDMNPESSRIHTLVAMMVSGYSLGQCLVSFGFPWNFFLLYYWEGYGGITGILMGAAHSSYWCVAFLVSRYMTEHYVHQLYYYNNSYDPI